MGINITTSTFSDQAEQAFSKKLQQNLQALKKLMQRPGFAQANKSSFNLGAELEMYIIDKQGQPLSINQQILDAADDEQLTLELNRYNLEYNLSPCRVQEGGFDALEQEIVTQISRLNQHAEKLGGRIIPIGILPTLETGHFGPEYMTDRQRYHTLVERLIDRRGSHFQIDINGKDPLQLAMEDVTLEGANTSFQIHYRIEPDQFADTFNAFQLVTPLVVALAANSPGLFAHQLWQETRIPLFKQSIDTRIKDRYQWHEPARVNFGHGWVHEGAYELFQQTVNLYPPLLPICGEEDALNALIHGRTPKLEEMRLHQGSVWLWNRPVYDDADDGHLRIELRALPAGPTPADMVANAVFYIGLAEAYRDSIRDLLPALPFPLAKYNFYRAAQHGLEAKIIWPDASQSGCQEVPIIKVLQQVTGKARQALQKLNISQQEIDKYMGIIEHRIEQCQTGASWQNESVAHYCKNHSDKEAQRLMLEDYIRNSKTNTPIAEWEV